MRSNGVAVPPPRMQNACMVALQIRDVPEEVRDILAQRAQQEGQSLQAFLLDVVKAEAERANNLSVLARFEGRTDGLTDDSSDIGQEIAELRRARDAELGESG